LHVVALRSHGRAELGFLVRHRALLHVLVGAELALEKHLPIGVVLLKLLERELVAPLVVARAQLRG
jgi:hypothetical protein